MNQFSGSFQVPFFYEFYKLAKYVSTEYFLFGKGFKNTLLHGNSHDLLKDWQNALFIPLQKLPPVWFKSNWCHFFKELLHVPNSHNITLYFLSLAMVGSDKGIFFFNMFKKEIWKYLLRMSSAKKDNWTI